ncbi:MAG TPA: alanine--glyoxylate aminotransferase family protein, partial [Beutenbergiaceae bacterium]|nr:alanine--glyoxylate aminotransferase family protein [Beutenbergiaceae bacterium]
GLTTLLEEGIPAAAARHREAGQRLQNRVEDHGWELFAAEGHRLPMLTSVVVPDGVDSAAVRAWLLENKNIEIGAGTGAYATKIWRIGLMGPNATNERADYLFDALVEAVNNA